MGFSPEGLPAVALAAFGTSVVAWLGCTWLAVAGLAVTAFVGHFFRDPERIGPEDPDLAVAPADGKVVKVAPMVDPLTGETRTAVCIFMNVFDVHVNRLPVAAEVRRLRYHPGKFCNACLDKASEHNERHAVGLLDTHGGQWTVVQIAGLIARRIVCFVEPGDVLGRGERFGLIKFGSRVDVYLPEGWEPLVTVGDWVLAGQSALARRRSDS